MVTVRWCRVAELIYRVAQKVGHYQMIKKSYYIVLKHANEIRFIIKLKCESNTITLFVGIRYSMRDLYFLTSKLCLTSTLVIWVKYGK